MVNGTDNVQKHCSGYNYVDDLCVRHTSAHKDSRSGSNKHIYTTPEGDVGGDKELLCDNLSVNNITIWLHLSQRRNSEALPPTGLWGEGPTADGWADTGEIWFIGWFSICGL